MTGVKKYFGAVATTALIAATPIAAVAETSIGLAVNK